jgi:hypothetical protein
MTERRMLISDLPVNIPKSARYCGKQEIKIGQEPWWDNYTADVYEYGNIIYLLKPKRK